MRWRGANASSLPVMIYHAALVGALLLWSWHEWADPTTDAGFNLYTFWQMAEGKVLFRDLVYFHGPLSPLIGALVFHFFGASLQVLAISSALFVGAIAQGIFEIFSWATDRATALACSTFFLMALAFSQLLPTANYNFIAPYKFELLDGTFCLVALQVFMLRFYRNRKSGNLVGAGVCLGASLLLSAEVAATAVALAFSGFAVCLWLSAKIQGKSVRTLLYFLGSAAIPPLLAWLYFSRNFPWLRALALVFQAELVPFRHQELTRNIFFRSVTGWDRPWPHVGELLTAAAIQLVFWGMLAGLSVAMRQLPKALRWSVGAVVPLGLYVISVITPSVGPFPWWNFPRALPLVAGLLCVGAFECARRAGEDPDRRGRWIALVFWGVFACGYVFKINLKCTMDFYGVFLAMPALLAGVVSVTYLLPNWMESKRVGAGLVFRLTGFGMVMAVAATNFSFSSEVFAAKTLVLGTGPDIMTGWPLSPPYREIAAVLAWIERNTLPASTLLVLPEGQAINYLSRRVQPGSYALSPMNYFLLGEESALAAWRAAPPDFVVFRSHDNSEFGLAGFGQGDYGRQTLGWLRQNYQTCVQFGDSPWEDHGHGVQILKRRSEPLAGIDENGLNKRKIGC